ncbi:MAG: histidine phosphatase family protein [Chitinivibrionia bacterium]|nr:histidine phosphatase family protein [Chitinivibrionia bacterium]
MRILYLVRHGESEWNEQGRIQGYLDSGLTELGREQARYVGLELAKHPIQFAATSSAVRAFDTCSIALGCFESPVPVEKTDSLREIRLGVWEGVKAADLKKDSPDQVDLWFHRPSKVRIEGGETLRAFRRRIAREMERLRAEHARETAVVFTHGGVICSYLTSLLGMKLDDLWRFKIRNGSITKILFPLGKPRIELLGDIHHLNGAVRPPGQSGIPGFSFMNTGSDQE